MFLADLIFLLQFSVALPHLSVISEVNPESYLVVAFIIKLCVDAHVPDFELTTRLALRCQKRLSHRALRLPFILYKYDRHYWIDLCRQTSSKFGQQIELVNMKNRISRENLAKQKRRNILNQ